MSRLPKWNGVTSFAYSKKWADIKLRPPRFWGSTAARSTADFVSIDMRAVFQPTMKKMATTQHPRTQRSLQRRCETLPRYYSIDIMKNKDQVEDSLARKDHSG